MTTRASASSVRIECLSEPYMGVPIKIRVTGLPSDASNSDWAGLYTPSGSRLTWDWMRPSSSGRAHEHTFKLSITQDTMRAGGGAGQLSDSDRCTSTSRTQSHQQNDPLDSRGYAAPIKLRCKYFRNGGWFSSGELVGDHEIELLNPLELVETRVGAETIEINFTLKTRSLIKNARSLFTITTEDGVRVGQIPMTTGFFNSMKGKVKLALPRVGGAYRIHCLYNEEGSALLWSRAVRLESPAPSRLFVSQLSSGGAAELRSLSSAGALGSALVCRPNTPVTLLVVPPARGGVQLTNDDKVFITEAVFGASAAGALGGGDLSDKIEGSPAPKEFQVPESRLDLTAEGVCALTFARKGVYFASVALKHPNGVFLPAGSAVVFVTDRAPEQEARELAASSVSTASSQGGAHAQSPPRPVVVGGGAPLQAVGGARSSDHLCVVCCDRSVACMLRPCNHVCLCERCEAEMKEKRMLRDCPMCRKAVAATERVYF